MKDSPTHSIPEGITNQQGNPPALKIDYELYQHYLDESDLSEAEKKEFLDTLWSIIVSFVDLGFGVHPVQQVSEEKLLLDEFITSSVHPVLEGNEPSNNDINNEKVRFNNLAQEGSPE